jgi:hypothetical protein
MCLASLGVLVGGGTGCSECYGTDCGGSPVVEVEWLEAEVPPGDSYTVCVDGACRDVTERVVSTVLSDRENARDRTVQVEVAQLEAKQSVQVRLDISRSGGLVASYSGDVTAVDGCCGAYAEVGVSDGALVPV